jgi:Transposase DDE domain
MGRKSKPSPARYCASNWISYTAPLRKCGTLLIWLDKEMTWLAPHDGSPGRPAMFSDAAIQFCLTIKVLFRLPLRQTAWPERSYCLDRHCFRFAAEP